MAKQVSNIKIRGTVDGLNFYHNKLYGNLVRRKPGPKPQEVKKGENYENLRRHLDEWGRAAHYSKVIRYAFHEMTRISKDGKRCNRLNKRLFEIIKMDKESAWGNRDLRRNTLTVFSHFELDEFCLSSKYFELPVETVFENGCLEVIAGIRLKQKLQDAGAWKIVSVAASIDLTTDRTKVDVQTTDLFEIEKGSFGVQLQHYVEDGATLFHGMCISFFKYDALTDDYKEIKKEHVNAGFLRYVG